MFVAIAGASAARLARARSNHEALFERHLYTAGRTRFVNPYQWGNASPSLANGLCGNLHTETRTDFDRVSFTEPYVLTAKRDRRFEKYNYGAAETACSISLPTEGILEYVECLSFFPSLNITNR